MFVPITVSALIKELLECFDLRLGFLLLLGAFFLKFLNYFLLFILSYI